MEIKKDNFEDNSEEYSAIINEVCANTEFETNEEHTTAGRRKKKAKTGELKQEYKKVTNKLRELKNIPMYGAKIEGDFKSLLFH